MADVKWIKIVTDIFDDEKILLIESLPEADSIIVIWFKLLCLAGKQNNSGVFQINGRIPYTDEMFATIFRRKLNTVKLALSTFEQFGMVEVVNDTITIPNWEKHQQLDALEMAREATRKRVARHREKQKQLAQGNVTNNVTGNVISDVSVTPGNADRIDKSSLNKSRSSSCCMSADDENATSPTPSPTPSDDMDNNTHMTVEAYASQNLDRLSPNNMQELQSFKDDLPDELIMYAIDEACANGKRVYSYVRRILNDMLDQNIRTVGEFKARQAKYHKSKDSGTAPAPDRKPLTSMGYHELINHLSKEQRAKLEEFQAKGDRDGFFAYIKELESKR